MAFAVRPLLTLTLRKGLGDIVTPIKIRCRSRACGLTFAALPMNNLVINSFACLIFHSCPSIYFKLVETAPHFGTQLC